MKLKQNKTTQIYVSTMVHFWEWPTFIHDNKAKQKEKKKTKYE